MKTLTLVAKGMSLYDSCKEIVEVISTHVEKNHNPTESEVDYADSLFPRQKYTFEVVDYEC